MKAQGRQGFQRNPGEVTGVGRTWVGYALVLPVIPCGSRTPDPRGFAQHECFFIDLSYYFCTVLKFSAHIVNQLFPYMTLFWNLSVCHQSRIQYVF
jgi:hypothetical protein